MTAHETNRAAEESAEKVGPSGVSPAGTPPPPDKSPIPAKAKDHNIHVSSEVLDAAGKDGEELLRSLRTAPEGLTQAEAEERERTGGPNEAAQEQIGRASC